MVLLNTIVMKLFLLVWGVLCVPHECHEECKGGSGGACIIAKDWRTPTFRKGHNNYLRNLRVYAGSTLDHNIEIIMNDKKFAYKCGKDFMIPEASSLRIEKWSNEEIFHAWCIKGDTKVKLQIYKQYGLTKASSEANDGDFWKGDWNCSFLTKKNVPHQYLGNKNNVYKHTDGIYYIRVNCIVKIKSVARDNSVSYHNTVVNNYVKIPPCDFYYNTTSTNSKLLNIKYSTVDKYEKYNCGEELSISKNQQRAIIVDSPNKMFYHTWCMKQNRTYMRQYGMQNNVQKFSSAINIYGDEHHEGAWDCVFLTDKNVPTQSTDGPDTVCQLNNSNYVRIDCNIKIILQIPQNYNTVFFAVWPQKAHLGDNVTFTCTTPDPSDRIFRIFYKSFDGNNVLQGTVGNNRKQYKVNFTMNLRHNLDVTCETYMDKNYRDKMQENTVTLQYLPDIETTQSPPLADKELYKPQAEHSSNKGFPMNQLLLYGSIVGGIALILILLLVTYRTFRKQAADPKSNTGITYENLTNELQRPLPPFPQAAKLEETYISPVDCQESPYAVCQNRDTDTYAQPFIPKLEDLYSRPAPKNARLDSRTLYSQVVPKSQRGNTSKELTYAEIQHGPPVGGDKSANAGGAGYANLAGGARGPGAGRGDYSNVFSGPYCNTKGRPDDYAEPAYCQVNRT